MASFWQDDDDDAHPLSQSIFLAASQQQAGQSEYVSEASRAQAFRCLHCDSTECYVDETTDRQVCANCHTESLQPSQSQVTMDYEEVVGLAAKSHGAIRLLKRPRITSARRFDETLFQQKLEDMDQSVTLPDLETCIIAFQTVLFHTMERLLELLDWKQDAKRRRQAHRLLRTLWADYLVAWRRGAEQYAQLYPHIRFSLRDAFICSLEHRKLINKTLSYHALKRVRRNLAEADGSGVEDDGDTGNVGTAGNQVPQAAGSLGPPDTVQTPSHDDSSDSDTGDSSESDDSESSNAQEDDDGDDDDHSIGSSSRKGSDNNMDNRSMESSSRKRSNKTRSDNTVKSAHRKRGDQSVESKILHILKKHSGRNEKTYLDIVLHPACRPSMNLATAFLFLTVYRAGVTSHQLCHWIQTGSLPMLNTFTLLDNAQQRRLRPIQYFFEMVKPLARTKLEQTTSALAVICRMKALPELMLNGLSALKLRAVGYITSKNLPCIIAQMISAMGLKQSVLDRCLVLLGLLPIGHDCGTGNHQKQSQEPGGPVEQPEEASDSQPPISTDQIKRLEDVAALIAIACFFDPEWRQWRYIRPSCHGSSSNNRFVPCFPEQLQYLGNGESLETYLSFVEDMILFEKDSFGPKFADLLESSQATRFNHDGTNYEESSSINDDRRESIPDVRPFPFIAGVTSQRKADVNAVLDPPRKLLIEFIALSVGVGAYQVETRINELLS